MSFFTKLGNVKFLGDWKIGNKEYSLEEKVQPILDAGVFSIQTTQTGTSISGGVKLLAGTGCSFVQDDENKTITLNATGIEVTLPEYALSASGKKINLTKDGSISSTITLADDLYETTGAVASHNISTDCHSDIRLAISEVRSIAEGRSSAKVFDTAEEFKKCVADYFVDAYEKGFTPNPCVVCNKEVKFKPFIEYTKKLSADYFATGHYASIVHENDGHILKVYLVDMQHY